LRTVRKLGGNLLPGGTPDFKADDLALVDWYTYNLETLGVPVKLNSKIDKDYILSNQFDAVIIATGSRPKILTLGDDDRVFTAEEALLKKGNVGNTVVVLGGGLIGCETALWLAKEGKKVIILEVLDKLLAVNAPLCHANSDMLEALIPYHHIEVKTSATAKAFRNGKLFFDTKNGEETIPCDSVVLAIGYNPNKSLYEEIRFEVPCTYLVGDARKVKNIMYAIWDAFEIANNL
jgi:2-enoate reductase